MPQAVTYLVGIDPSTNSSGFAVARLEEGQAPALILSGVCRTTMIQSTIESWALPDGSRVRAAIECPKAMYRGSAHVVRAVANTWEKELRLEFPRRLTMIGEDSKRRFVDPKVWRSALLSGMPTMDPKDASLWYVHNVLRHSEVASHDEAEAILIMTWASRKIRA